MIERLIPNKIRTALIAEGFQRGMNSIESSVKANALLEGYTSQIDFAKRVKELKDASDYESLMLLTTAYLQLTANRQSVIMAVERVKSFYLVSVMLDQLAQDALAPDIATNEILNIYSKDPEVNKEIRYLDDKFKFDRLVEEITPDMCAYGDYTLSLKVENKRGVIDIIDNVDQSAVISLINRGDILGFLSMDDKGQKLLIHAPYNFVCFSMLDARTRIDLTRSWTNATANSVVTMGQNFYYGTGYTPRDAITDDSVLPRYIRVGRSVIYPIINKLKELELLEMLVPATKIAQLSQGSILGLQVPPNYNPEKGFEASKRMEGLINAKIAFSTTNDMITADSIINAAGTTKVIPIFGEKGTVAKLDYKMSEANDLASSIDDTRRTICSSMGFPYEILFGGDGGNKSDLLKRYARYLRKVRGIQESISAALKHIICVHLANKDISYNPKEIFVTFKTKIMDIAEVEDLEFQDAAVSIVRNMIETIQTLTSLPGAEQSVNLQNFYRHIDKKFTTLGLPGIIIPDNVEKISKGGDGSSASDFFGGDSGGFDDDFGGGGGDMDTGDFGDEMGLAPEGEPDITPAGNTEGL